MRNELADDLEVEDKMGVNGHWYVEIEKQGFWRGSPHTWVNRYVMSGAQPSAADALTVIGALKHIEDVVYPELGGGVGVGFVEGRAYPSGNGSSFASVAYNTSLAPATATGFAGPTGGYASLDFSTTLESCLVIETKLAGLSSTGKPVFLRKYFRGISDANTESVGNTPIAAGDLAIIKASTVPWQTGVGASNWVVIGNSGAQAQSAPQPLQYVGNRQVPKGRKRTGTSSLSLTAKLIKFVEENPEVSLLADA